MAAVPGGKYFTKSKRVRRASGKETRASTGGMKQQSRRQRCSTGGHDGHKSERYLCIGGTRNQKSKRHRCCYTSWHTKKQEQALRLYHFGIKTPRQANAPPSQLQEKQNESRPFRCSSDEKKNKSNCCISHKNKPSAAADVSVA